MKGESTTEVILPSENHSSLICTTLLLVGTYIAKDARDLQASKHSKLFQYYQGSRYRLKIGLLKQYMNFCATS